MIEMATQIKCHACGCKHDSDNFVLYKGYSKPICRECADSLDEEYIEKFMPLLFFFELMKRMYLDDGER